MDSNKENKEPLNPSKRIRLSTEPLHLLNENKKKSARRPLRTIVTYGNVGGPSHATVSSEMLVTLKPTKEESGRNFFNDDCYFTNKLTNKKQEKGLNRKRKLSEIVPSAVPDEITQKKVEEDRLGITFNTWNYTEDVFSYLIVAEKKPLAIPKTSIFRAGVVNWIMKCNGPYGNPAVVQSACFYLDSILGVMDIQLHEIQVMAAASLWISQKLYGTQYPTKKLLKLANKSFSLQKMLAAEKQILQGLNFPAQPVVTHDFIYYFSWWCDNDCSEEIVVAATFLCMCGLMIDTALCTEFPSVIAAASVRSALHFLNKKHLIERLQMNKVYKLAEKKAKNLEYTELLLRIAVETVAAPSYLYKIPLEHGVYNSNIPQKIVLAAVDPAA